ncbi:hypothetical protein MPTK1_6g11320 [Marchantia polymorpha subsp. ruderalis]|uniref:EF-hand domain-containing protein n=2 Tax=Marchantia polymorpha TaxID=3197 RepID=A0AAF6BQW1_MARPO|nr:hypothetical protein MARPO_0016s0171 [Marchantia polymorpha]PTQ45129.1 hypothetical protein MARPO_0016s0171 [Marchantia polymorpha]BBN14395.1 hypothetical protein Mp_6g11320 [Marchantia polymorpha subsp. ruderalis]BBN14396.1 hypothetical protein Mp_6g11320 [Marchantia polymorpha subsp. ruderalis]|eukprot:PTQ45128.1 hypothetical protein MARPO_0016s0171 [Marchantia polymorpha]
MSEEKKGEEVPSEEKEKEEKKGEEVPSKEKENDAEAGASAEGAAEAKKEASADAPRRKSASEKEGGDQPSEVKKEGAGSEQPPKRRSSKDGPDAKRKSTRKSVKAAAGDHADGDLDDEDEEKEEEPKIIYPLEKKIQDTLRTAWTLFVKKNQKKKTEISEADVPNVMRSIGINPTETQIKTLIEYAKGQDLPTCSKGFLTYENFEQRIAETLQKEPELWVRKTKEEILVAMNTLCDNKSQIEADKLKKILMAKGDVMTDPEGSAMLRTARDRDTGMVYIDEYADILSKDAIPQPPPDPTVW